MPLTVEYKEKFASSGRVPGGFLKREMRPADREILVARLVDRVLRPLFPEDYHSETQVIITLLSFDENVAADSLAGLAASTALAISDIPFSGPISEVCVARVDGQMIVNPSPAQLALADIEMMIGATDESIVMVEGEMSEVSEGEMLEAISAAHAAIARDAWRRYGKGRHKAGLNLGDCFSYALAKERGQALLFKGDDFAATDIEPAIKNHG
jgi:polyribonucleotide nucleotidyltransferase